MSDSGFTLVEVLVATNLIAVIMAASTTFFVSAMSATRVQGGQQAAVQLATEGIEVVRALPAATVRQGTANPGGRWIPPAPAGSDDPEHPVRNAVRYARSWTVTACWQPPAGGSCGAAASGYLPFLRIVVAVTWRDRGCAAASCTFTTSTLISNLTRDPVFAR